MFQTKILEMLCTSNKLRSCERLDGFLRLFAETRLFIGKRILYFFSFYDCDFCCVGNISGSIHWDNTAGQNSRHN